MRKCANIQPYMRRPLVISDSLLNFLTYEENSIFFFISAGSNVIPFRSNCVFPNVFPFNAIRLSLMICYLDDKPPYEASLFGGASRETQDSARTEAEFMNVQFR
jgi:hypothetical protein